jgi:transcriptional regulator with XRE-family HTH domain
MDETQADLADELGVSDQTVARWEKGQVELPGPADYLIRLLYLECIGVTKGVRSLLETLRNTDEPVNGRVVFTKDGKWRLAKCA